MSKYRENDRAQALAKGGRVGEDAVTEVLENLCRTLPCQGFFMQGRRIPRPDRSGHFEIDFVFATPYQVVTIEVKNWAGKIAPTDEKAYRSDWVQTPRSGADRLHSAPLQLMKEKEQALLTWLSAKGIDVRQDKVMRLLVFVNQRSEVHEKIRTLREVVPLEKLEARLRKWVCPHPDKLSLFLKEWWVGFKGLRIFQRRGWRAFRRLLAELPSWDEIRLVSGGRLSGDLRSGIPTKKGTELTRDLFKTAQIHVPGDKWWQRWRSPFVKILDRQGLERKFRCSVEDSVWFQKAGSRKAQLVALNLIDTIEVGFHDRKYLQASAADQEISVGDEMEGEVASILDFGVFVRLTRFTDGMISLEDFEGDFPLKEGDGIKVRIERISKNSKGKEKIRLEWLKDD